MIHVVERELVRRHQAAHHQAEAEKRGEQRRRLGKTAVSRVTVVLRIRFFLVGPEDAALWIAIMEGEPLPARSYNHVAFKIAQADYQPARDRIAALGLEMREGRSRVTGEGESLYFYDHDNHLFELHTGTLDERLRRYAKGR